MKTYESWKKGCSTSCYLNLKRQNGTSEVTTGGTSADEMDIILYHQYWNVEDVLQELWKKRN